jgi:hypothetical protein
MTAMRNWLPCNFAACSQAYTISLWFTKIHVRVSDAASWLPAVWFQGQSPSVHLNASQRNEKFRSPPSPTVKPAHLSQIFVIITHSLMELSPSWEAANCAAAQLYVYLSNIVDPYVHSITERSIRFQLCNSNFNLKGLLSGTYGLAHWPYVRSITERSSSSPCSKCCGESASISPFSSFTKLLPGWYPLLKSFLANHFIASWICFHIRHIIFQFYYVCFPVYFSVTNIHAIRNVVWLWVYDRPFCLEYWPSWWWP